MTLTELQDIAIRQQQQIEINQQLLLAKEKRLKLLKIEDQKNQQLSMLTSNSFNLNGVSYNIHHQQQQQQQQHQKQTSGHSKTIENANKLENLKQSVLGQELKIFKLKELRNQIIKHKLSNSNMNSELELIKSLFTKKERELCDAIKNVSELTKQIEQLRKIKSLSFNTQSVNTPLNMLSANKNNVNACELEKLKQELQIRNKLNEQQAKKIMQQHELFNQKQLEVINLDRRIEELQNRISNKRNLNEQINVTCSKLKSNSFALSPKHDEQNQQLLIKDIDHNEDCETQEFINDQISYNNQNIIIHQQMQQQEKHSYQSNITSSEIVINNNTTSPSKSTAKFATKQEIANTYMNKYGSETFQRFQQNSIKILQQQQHQPSNESNNNNSSPTSPIESVSQSNNNKNSTNLTFQADNCNDSPSFTALPSHLKLEFDKIKYLPDMIKTIKKRHSISEVEGTSCSNTIPPLIFQKMLEKHHKNFLDQKQQQNQPKKLNQIQETPTETTTTTPISTASVNNNSNNSENYLLNKIQLKTETPINEILVPENQHSNITEVKSEKITDSIELNDSKDLTPVISSTITKSTKPIIKQTNNNNDNNFTNNWNNNKGNGVLFQNNNNNTRRVNFDPHALLLDAAVEGELDLVMKCAKLVNDISEPNDEGITALHNSVCAGHFEIVKFLVEFGCDINFSDNDGWTPVLKIFPLIVFILILIQILKILF
jgi:hypothetical protein